MSFEYFLRQSTRNHGSSYIKAIDMLVEMHDNVGLPEEGKVLIRKEIDDVLNLIDDQEIADLSKKRLGTLNNENHNEEVQEHINQNPPGPNVENIVKILQIFLPRKPTTIILYNTQSPRNPPQDHANIGRVSSSDTSAWKLLRN